jgi:tetratricopeptide (TPR) repeat protein
MAKSSRKESVEQLVFIVLAVVRRLIQSPLRRWFHVALSGVFIAWGAMVFSKNVPYFYYLNTAKVAYEYGNFAAAEDLYKIALDETEIFHHPDKRKVVLRGHLGELYFDECRYAESAAEYEKVLELQRRLKASEADIATTLLRLGIDRAKLRQYEKAERTLSASLQLRQRVRGKKLDLAEIEIALGQAESSLNKDQQADQLYSEASAIFLSRSDKNLGLALACLRDKLAGLNKLHQPEKAAAVAKQIASLKIPAANLSWSDFARFGYRVTHQILESTHSELKNPSLELRAMVATRALSEIAGCADQIAPAEEKVSPPEVGVDYLALTGPDKGGFLEVSVSAVRRTRAQSRFQLRYRLAFGRKSMEPILQDFAMLGSRRPLSQTKGFHNGQDVPEKHN